MWFASNGKAGHCTWNLSLNIFGRQSNSFFYNVVKNYISSNHIFVSAHICSSFLLIVRGLCYLIRWIYALPLSQHSWSIHIYRHHFEAGEIFFCMKRHKINCTRWLDDVKDSPVIRNDSGIIWSNLSLDCNI